MKMLRTPEEEKIFFEKLKLKKDKKELIKAQLKNANTIAELKKIIQDILDTIEF